MPVSRRSSTAIADPVADGGTGIVCPFCAHVRADAVGACPRCTMQDTPSTRRNTGERIGPWFVLQRKNPTAPGLRFNVILALARRGHVTARSIVRGPTTGQLWRYASDVKGLSRLFGSCWHCHAELSTKATSCSRCKSAQEPPDDPDAFLEGQAELPLMETAARVSLDEPAPAKPAPAQPAPAPLVEPALSSALDDAAIDPPARSRPRPEPRDAGLARITPAEPARPTRRATTAIDPMLSVSELAAAFQVPAPPRATFTRRVGRGLWKTAKVTSVLVLLTAAAGAVVFTVKPQWRDPARVAVEPYALATRDAAVRAGAWTKAAWHDAWNAGARTLARFNEPPAGAPNVDATSPSVTPAADPAANALPPATPIRPDPSAPIAPPEAKRPEAKRPETPRVEPKRPEVPPGATSIADVTPSAAPSPKPAAAPTDASWDALMGATGAAATRPTDDRAIVAAARPTIPANAAAAADASAKLDPAAKLDPSAEGGTPPPSAPVDAATTLPADPEMRAAQLDDQTGALLREADRVLAEARAADAARRPQQAAPTPPAAATPPPPAPTPSGTVANSGGVSTGQSSQTVDPNAPRPAATPAPKPAAPTPTVSLDQAMAQAATLRQKAFDAEARRDWPAALKFWEQIAALPEAARPSDVKVRLSIAKDRVKR